MSEIQFIDTPTLAKRMGCSEYTVAEMARDCRLPGIKFGKGWVFPELPTMQLLAHMAIQRYREHHEAEMNKPKATLVGIDSKRSGPPELPELPTL
jgi:hypothetical protein